MGDACGYLNRIGDAAQFEAYINTESVGYAKFDPGSDGLFETRGPDGNLVVARQKPGARVLTMIVGRGCGLFPRAE